VGIRVCQCSNFWVEVVSMEFLGQIGRFPYRDLGIRIGNEIGFVVGRFEVFFLFLFLFDYGIGICG
jgi:hypothetical protein